MPDIVVLRGDGTHQGEDVVEPLLATIHSCQFRGRIELDSGSGLSPVSMECVYRDGLLLGHLVEVFNPFSGALRYGKITAIDHRVTVSTIETTLRVDVVSEDLL